MSTENQNPVTIKMETLVEGVNTVFAGVIRMLQSMQPDVAKELVCIALSEDAGEAVNAAGEQVAETAKAKMPAAEDTDNGKPTVKESAVTEATVQESVAETQEGQDDTCPAPVAVTQDDITRIIVRKVKQDRSNNEKIGSILKSYGYEHISDLPVDKYEQFITDISQL